MDDFSESLEDTMTKAMARLSVIDSRRWITFLLDINPEDALKRRLGRCEEEDRLEALGTSFQEKVREGYLSAAHGAAKRLIRKYRQEKELWQTFPK